MIAIGHTSVGVIIATSIMAVSGSGPLGPMAFVLAIVLGIAFHYLADLVPHGHYYINSKQLNKKQLTIFFLDLFGGAALFLIMALWKFGITSEYFWLVLVAIAASQLTDVVEGLAAFKLIPKTKAVQKHSAFHLLVHWHNEPGSKNPGYGRPIRWSDLWQFLAFCLALVALIVV